jgi:heme/copper-type cytochrome/quinol oxidase subunit 2
MTSAMKITAKQGVVSGRIVILTDDTAIKPELVPIQMSAKDFVLNPTNITANLGDTLKITFTGDDNKYSFYLPEFKLKVTVLPKQTKTFSFKVNKKGKFILKGSTVFGGVNKTLTTNITVI